MKKYYFLLVSFLIFSGAFVLAQAPGENVDITYPVTELGNCGSEPECLAYCDLPENMGPCLDFAEANDLMRAEDIALARAMLEAGQTTGPGGCQGILECEAYCDDINHLSECLAFAEEHNLIPPEELEEARKVAAALEQGIEPPGCNNKDECDIYCSQPENMEECITFAIAAGLFPEEELEEMQMVLQAIRAGATPPPCMSEEECDEYCSAPEHLDQCITFAVAAGFMTAEEAEMVRLTGGKGPGDCRGKEECETYCDDPAHAEACMNFALEYGLMSSEDAENYRRMVAAGFTSGPGGCQGEAECEAYCDDMAHMEECMNFAVEMGFMSPEDADRARKMGAMGGGPGDCRSEQECRDFCDDPANMEECMNFSVQMGEMSPEEAEEARRGMEMMTRGGPGGCQSERECMMYCEDPSHMEECMNFAVEMGQQMMQMRETGEEMMEGGMPYEEMTQPSDGEAERMMREEMERETERRMQQQMQQMQQQQQQAESCDTPGANRSCGSEIGTCLVGIQICQAGFWGECIGGRMPQPEMCDGVDNDCDGQTDEGGACTGGQSLFDRVRNFLADLVGLD